MRTRLTIQTLDLHAGGEPLRLITAGYPPAPQLRSSNVDDGPASRPTTCAASCASSHGGIATCTVRCCCRRYRDDADIAVLFMHNEGYSTMCGHGIIALTAGLIEEGLFPATTPETVIRFEAPAGLIVARAEVGRAAEGPAEVRDVRFTNVPSYLAARDLALRPDGVPLAGAAAERGALSVDVAFGGAYYGIVDAAELGLRVVPS